MSELDRIRSALAYIDANDRDTWLRIGMAIKSQLGDEGFEIWDEWSKQADPYNAKDSRNVWKSIKLNGKVGIGTLFHEAKNHGWQSDEPPRKLTTDEIDARRANAAARTARLEAEERENQKAAMQEAATILGAAVGDPATHPYIRQKNLRYVGQRVKRGYWPQRNWPDALLIPIYHPERQIWSIEAINVDGKKDSLKNGKKSGGFTLLEKLLEPNMFLLVKVFPPWLPAIVQQKSRQ
jgi:putative DNA primase/helicase